MTVNTELLIIIIVLVVGAIALAAFLVAQRREARRLRTKYGAEYTRLMAEERGQARRVEHILEEREKRVRTLHLRHLTPAESDRFANDWRLIQEEFVDNPSAAVTRADALVAETLAARGYTMANFEERAAGVSVEYPQMVADCRIAHEIAERDHLGKATTEDLRRAMQHYRNLFEHLIETRVVHAAEVRR